MNLNFLAIVFACGMDLSLEYCQDELGEEMAEDASNYNAEFRIRETTKAREILTVKVAYYIWAAVHPDYSEVAYLAPRSVVDSGPHSIAYSPPV